MNSVELFAGAGGLGMGLHLAGFKPLQVVEWDRFCCDTIRENQAHRVAFVDGWPVVEGDIRGLSFTQFDGKTDLILGNFSIGPSKMKSKYDWHKGPTFLVLKNMGKRNIK